MHFGPEQGGGSQSLAEIRKNLGRILSNKISISSHFECILTTLGAENSEPPNRILTKSRQNTSKSNLNFVSFQIHFDPARGGDLGEF